MGLTICQMSRNPYREPDLAHPIGCKNFVTPVIRNASIPHRDGIHQTKVPYGAAGLCCSGNGA
jgi:hypothetical protein